MARRHGFVTRGRRQVRDTLWLSIAESITNLGAPSTAALINVQGAGVDALRPFTIVRSVGFFGIRTDQTSASESYDCALAFSVVTDQAAAIGITAIPTGFTDMGSDDFFVHQILMDRMQFSTSAGFDPHMLRGYQYESKAMRKVSDSSTVVFTIESSTLGTGVTVHHAGRQLIKLH